ncbi:MAG: DUF4412 domain-containing protein [Lentimicrobiaceae bacterium]|nr:DUF4412 domain-containing protein [Lentimicrobiaceae bacterium]
MRKILLFIIIISSVFSLNAQQSLVYQSYVLDSDSGDTSFVEVKRFGRQLKIQDINTFEGQLIPGMSEKIVYADYKANRVYNQSRFDDGDVYYCSHSFENSNVTYTLEGEEYMNGYECRKYRTTINSNSIEIWMTDKLGFNATPIVNRGFLRGVLVRQVINGNRITELNSVIKDKRIKQERIPIDLGILVPAKEMTRITSDKLVIKKNIFDNEQIYFADIEKFEGEIPYDSVIHFAHGTLILKRVYLDTLPEHYSYFIEMKEQSNGDAYDRSGSVFVIPTDRELSLEDALLNDIELLHSYTDRRGITYRAIKLEDDFVPVVELIRFFTPFGVNHYNDRVHIDGLEWSDMAYYKQEVTELSKHLRGDVLIGAFIGNYDSGGHMLSLDLNAYPGDYKWDISQNDDWTLPLFNTCNVMEMAGQHYGRLFKTDSLVVEFDVPENVDNLRLRYITTGHGGWGGGDEFNPKENTIIIDGEKKFTYTPWRCDCATFRELNPVSGNFWNAQSSSDLSRSGWCPGLAAQPVYFDMSFLEPGKHTITIAIPQGDDEGSSFNHWMVSGVLIGTENKIIEEIVLPE